MDYLFPVETVFPPGFSYREDFITEAEEDLLCSVISQITLRAFVFRGYEAKRKVMSYGYDYHFNDRTISKGEIIPKEFKFLVDKVGTHLNIAPDKFQELLVTEYPPGAVINWHRDAPPFELVAGISLVSDCKFRLRPYEKTKQKRSSILSIPVKRRSLYVMRDEARQEWEHSIDKLKQPRYSITLRTLRSGSDKEE